MSNAPRLSDRAQPGHEAEEMSALASIYQRAINKAREKKAGGDDAGGIDATKGEHDGRARARILQD